MKCPHCLTDFHDRETIRPLVEDVDGKWGATHRTCPACGRAMISLIRTSAFHQQRDGTYCVADILSGVMMRPKATNRTPPSSNVPDDVKGDYREACLVLSDSPKASAALSRRCLQHLLRKHGKVKGGDLNSEIDDILAQRTLPTPLAHSIDAIRTLGNFAAHPIKSKATGEIVDVETGEAEWNLDVLESLFDFFFDQPAFLESKREALNKKLTAAGKPILKKAP